CIRKLVEWSSSQLLLSSHGAAVILATLFAEQSDRGFHQSQMGCLMKTCCAVAGMLLGVLLSTNSMGQNFNASVGGFVQDTSQAYIPGVMVTATNTQTGVASGVVTNESGAYTIPSLLPGIYKISAELPGFRTQVFNDVQLGNGVNARYNFTLQVGAV